MPTHNSGLTWRVREISQIVMVIQRADVPDTTARDFKLTFESPKNEELSLFRHGELAYEHLILTPPKSKGMIATACPEERRWILTSL